MVPISRNRLFNVFLFVVLSSQLAYQQKTDCQDSDKTRIAVIGAGVGGLSTLRHLSHNLPDADIVAFDVNKEIGGTWLYNERVGLDDDGVPLMSSMYQNLRTNLPKGIMALPDFPIPANHKSFLSHDEFFTYLKSFAKYFNVYKYIKFRHAVMSVKFINSINKWKITYRNLLTQVDCSEIFDYVIVANGHHTQYVVPEYKGLELFKGTHIHSHYYRAPEVYSNRTVLIVGAGPSGVDISIDVAKWSNMLFISHHKRELRESKTPFPSHYVQKPDILEFREHSVVFIDGSEEFIDDIIFCTGYTYHCPFLDSSAGVSVSRLFLYPLYRHIVNIEHPSMFFIGIPQLCCTIPLMDIQARYVTAAIQGKFKLPSKEKMIAHMEYDYKMKNKTAFARARIATHTLGIYENVYYSEMGEEAGIKPLPPVYCAVRQSTMETKSNLFTYRNYNYYILDDEHFIRVYGEGTDNEKRTVYNSSLCVAPTKTKRREDEFQERNLTEDIK